jgi:hypothetical protein
MRTLSIFVATMALATFGCGGSSDSNGGKTNSNGRNTATGQCPGASSSGAAETCTGEDAYQQCILASCTPQFQACFGNGFTSGNFTGGACADYMGCQMACPCDSSAVTCETACQQKMLANPSCMTCMTTVSTCTLGSGCAQPVCTPATATSTNTKTTTSTATATGGSCAAVGACCATLTAGATAAQYQSTCATIVAAGEATCAQILSSWQSAGLCK